MVSSYFDYLHFDSGWMLSGHSMVLELVRTDNLFFDSIRYNNVIMSR